MGDANTINTLKQSKFFCEVPEEELDKLSALCRIVNLPQQTVLFEEYGRAKDVYVILDGEISLAICEPRDSCRQIAVVGEGDLIGWSALLGRTRLSDTACTLSPVKAIMFDGQALSAFCAEHPATGYQFMRQATQALALRLSGTRLQLLEMCGSRLPQVGVRLESD
jgi:CRP-like cAMP-binding protein